MPKSTGFNQTSHPTGEELELKAKKHDLKQLKIEPQVNITCYDGMIDAMKCQAVADSGCHQLLG